MQPILSVEEKKEGKGTNPEAAPKKHEQEAAEK
jgi:hypothetical protein